MWKRTFPTCFESKLRACIRKERRDRCKCVALDECAKILKLLWLAAAFTSDRKGLPFLLKISFAGLGSEFISNYLTVEMTMPCYFKLLLVWAQVSILLTESLSRHPNPRHDESVWHRCLCTRDDRVKSGQLVTASLCRSPVPVPLWSSTDWNWRCTVRVHE